MPRPSRVAHTRSRYLSRAFSESLLLCGCGVQALEQLRAVLCVRSLARIGVFDLDAMKATAFAAASSASLGLDVAPVHDLHAAMLESDIVVTCTTSKKFFVTPAMVRAGTFIAAVGADNEDKQEIDPELMARAKVVTDSTDQASRIGDLHHAIVAGAMRAADVHGELCEIIAQAKPARENDEEITIFDSTGTGFQDVAAAIAVYRQAKRARRGTAYEFA